MKSNGLLKACLETSISVSAEGAGEEINARWFTERRGHRLSVSILIDGAETKSETTKNETSIF